MANAPTVSQPRCADFPKGKEAHLDSTSVVLYLKQFHPSVPDGDSNRSSARIQTVFEQLLECRSRAMYDLKAAQGINGSERGSAQKEGEPRNGLLGLTSPAAMRLITSSCSRRIDFGSGRLSIVGPAVDCTLSIQCMYARVDGGPSQGDATRLGRVPYSHLADTRACHPPESPM